MVNSSLDFHPAHNDACCPHTTYKVLLFKFFLSLFIIFNGCPLLIEASAAGVSLSTDKSDSVLSRKSGFLLSCVTFADFLSHVVKLEEGYFWIHSKVTVEESTWLTNYVLIKLGSPKAAQLSISD